MTGGGDADDVVVGGFGFLLHNEMLCRIVIYLVIETRTRITSVWFVTESYYVCIRSDDIDKYIEEMI